jgi:hypothetical protein
MCIDGPCYYQEQNGLDTTVMMTTFVMSHVVSNICQILSDSAAVKLGKPRLRLIYSPFLTRFLNILETT